MGLGVIIYWNQLTEVDAIVDIENDIENIERQAAHCMQPLFATKCDMSMTWDISLEASIVRKEIQRQIYGEKRQAYYDRLNAAINSLMSSLFFNSGKSQENDPTGKVTPKWLPSPDSGPGQTETK